jgi:hypothetical protein
MLGSKPIRNQAVNWEKGDDGEVLIRIPRGEYGWRIKLLSKFFYIPKERKISLDEVGSQVWELCDGETRVKDIIDRLRRKYKLNRKEAEISLVTYLRDLGKKGLVGFAVDKS